jgi:hypothetical protein
MPCLYMPMWAMSFRQKPSWVALSLVCFVVSNEAPWLIGTLVIRYTCPETSGFTHQGIHSLYTSIQNTPNCLIPTPQL